MCGGRFHFHAQVLEPLAQDGDGKRTPPRRFELMLLTMYLSTSSAETLLTA